MVIVTKFHQKVAGVDVGRTSRARLKLTVIARSLLQRLVYISKIAHAPYVAVKRLQSKITQNTKKQTNSRKSRTGLHKTGARTEGGLQGEDDIETTLCMATCLLLTVRAANFLSLMSRKHAWNRCLMEWKWLHCPHTPRPPNREPGSMRKKEKKRRGHGDDGTPVF